MLCNNRIRTVFLPSMGYYPLTTFLEYLLRFSLFISRSPSYYYDSDSLILKASWVFAPCRSFIHMPSTYSAYALDSVSVIQLSIPVFFWYVIILNPFRFLRKWLSWCIFSNFHHFMVFMLSSHDYSTTIVISH